MDLVTDSRALSMIRQLMDNTSTTRPVFEQKPQKPKFRPSEIKMPFERATPESQGVPSAHIADFLNALREDRTLDMHGVTVLRNGKVIAQAMFGAYDPNVWHITHSECKSITGLAIGMLIGEGKLSPDDRLIDLFAGRVGKLNALTHRNITVKHLLTMTSGVSFNEAGSVTETDWVKCFFESAVPSEPGTSFNYNSMNTYLLSCVVRQVTGQGLTEYLTPRLFEPLGIENFFWEKCPMGNEKGGWGLYILPEDIAKIGQTVLEGGRFRGKQIVPEEWVREATRAQVKTPETLGAYDYGYQIWVGRNERSFLFNGMFGQNVLGYPDANILLVSNAGNNELFQQSSFYPLVTKYFSEARFSDGPIRESKAGRKALAEAKRRAALDLYVPQTKLFGGLFESRRTPDVAAACKALDGRAYFASDKRAASVGLYPLYAQTLQNNFAKGLGSLSFSCRNGTMRLIVDETDERHTLDVGFGAPAYGEITTHGETHCVGVSGRFAADEDGMPVLTVRVSFLEAANSRMIKIRFFDGRIETEWSESPGRAYLTEALCSIKGQSTLMGNVLGKFDEELLMFRIARVFEPKVVLTER